MLMLKKTEINIYIIEEMHPEVMTPKDTTRLYQVLELLTSTMVPFCTNNCTISLSKVLVSFKPPEIFQLWQALDCNYRFQRVLNIEKNIQANFWKGKKARKWQ